MAKFIIWSGHVTVRIVYFSSSTETTSRFVDKVGIESERLPLRRNDPELFVDYDYVLIVPTYGGGVNSTAVPRQVVKFLNVEENRKHCIGVIASGNTNFGEAYLLGGKIVANKLKVPLLFGFEMMGTAEDVVQVRDGLTENWERLVSDNAKRLKESNDE